MAWMVNQWEKVRELVQKEVDKWFAKEDKWRIPELIIKVGEEPWA